MCSSQRFYLKRKTPRIATESHQRSYSTSSQVSTEIDDRVEVLLFVLLLQSHFCGEIKLGILA